MSRSQFATHSAEVTNPPTPTDEFDASSEPTPSAVLLVARDLSLGESCRRSLSDAGIDVVVSVPNEARAHELLTANQLFDAVVISVGPGDVEAVKLAQFMNRYHSDTPTVVMSPMGGLDIPGMIPQRGDVQSSDASHQSSVFKRTIRRAISVRRSMRLRRSSAP